MANAFIHGAARKEITFMRQFLKILFTLTFIVHDFGIAVHIIPEIDTSIPIGVKERVKRSIVLIEKTTAQADGRTTNLRRDDPITYTRTQGTLIAPSWVLSSARTARGMAGGWALVNGKNYAVEYILTSPKFFDENLDFDNGNVALVKLRDPVVGFADFPDHRVLDANMQTPFLVASTEFAVNSRFTEDGILSFPRYAVGEIARLGSCIGISQLDAHLENPCIISLLCSYRPLNFQNFQTMSWDFGAGLFSSDGAMVGILVRSIDASVDSGLQHENVDVEGPVNFQIDTYATFDEETLHWISQTLRADRALDVSSFGGAMLAFLCAAKRPESGLSALPLEIIRHIASLVVPSLYVNYGGWITNVRNRAHDPSHGQNLRALLANPMVRDEDAEPIANALLADLTRLDGSAGNTNL
jgi:hypothetical protein